MINSVGWAVPTEFGVLAGTARPTMIVKTNFTVYYYIVK